MRAAYNAVLDLIAGLLKGQNGDLFMRLFSLDSKLRQFLENFRDTMKSGNSTIGMPILDPFEMEEYDFMIDEEIVQ